MRKHFLDLSLNALLLSQGLCAALFLALCSMLLAPCSFAHAQQAKKVPRIGILTPERQSGYRRVPERSSRAWLGRGTKHCH